MALSEARIWVPLGTRPVLSNSTKSSWYLLPTTLDWFSRTDQVLKAAPGAKGWMPAVPELASTMVTAEVSTER